jgi:hypothetical protein
LPKLNLVEPPWYGPVCPVVGEGWHREVSPYPDHHATIFEMNVESYRRRAALERKRGRGRPPIHATITANA